MARKRPERKAHRVASRAQEFDTSSNVVKRFARIADLVPRWTPTRHACGRACAEQHVEQTYPDGVVGELGFAIRGTLTAGAAQGTIRLVARFYHGAQQWNACDSLDVA